MYKELFAKENKFLSQSLRDVKDETNSEIIAAHEQEL
jgi:hypothetical protein